MIAPVFAFLITPLGRYVAVAVMLVGAWLGFAHHYEKKGASRVSAQIEKRITEHAKTADTERAAVKSLPADRLRDPWTRD